MFDQSESYECRADWFPERFRGSPSDSNKKRLSRNCCAGEGTLRHRLRSPTEECSREGGRQIARSTLRDDRGAKWGVLAPSLAVAFILILSIALGAAEMSKLTAQMAMHILAMSLVAPLTVHALATARPGSFDALGSGRAIAATTVAQLVLLWAAHAPALPMHGASAVAYHAAFQLALFGAAVLFWGAVLAQRGPNRWRSIVALLLTGKLFCLLAALLVFAPRALYAGHAHHLDQAALLADQQLAGLLMISACPITYVGAAIVIAARLVRESERSGSTPPPLLRRRDA